ncbi:MAG: hypothetical protein DMH00_12945 [Acidobacteria bacterium]|nr:MAG: hypothetical protein DMH00_12945 [Acidobacteriota bacterium]
MWRAPVLASTSIAIASLLVGTLFACCISSPFEQQIRWAKVIFAGTLRSAQPVRLPGTIVTRYRFEDVRYVKGQGPPDSLVLVQVGGSDGMMEVISSIGVSFQVGTRYVVFADRGYGPLPSQYSPMSCGTGHPFAIRADSGSTIPVVHAGERAPIVAIDDLHVVVLNTTPWRPEMGGWLIRTGGQALAPSPPPRLPLDDLIRAFDFDYDARFRRYSETMRGAKNAGKLLRFVNLFPNQDPGTRVTEEEFLRVLSGIVARASIPSDDQTN